ncbi:MAG: 2-dehydropantoate 2-reductase [Caulobacter sp.]|nr:2-dehydropantoate 2-reductase [Caulobacter sp.]
MKVAIIGAGAIGGWLGVRLAKAGHTVSVLARGVTLTAIQTQGWSLVEGGAKAVERVAVSEDPAALGPQDLVILTVKGPALPDLAPRIAGLVGPSTLVMPAMNGVPWWFLLGGGGDLPSTPLTAVDPTGAIAMALPFDRVVGCVVQASASVTAPGEVAHKAGNRLIIGAPDGASARAAIVSEAFEDAGFDVVRSDHIQRDIWYKLWGNMTMNPISALTGATCDRLLDDPLVTGFVLRVMAEAQTIGARIGCRIDERGEDRNAVTRGLGAFKTSMLQDAEAGRALELDQLLAAPREIASRLGVETPNLDALFGLARLFGRSRGLYPED